MIGKPFTCKKTGIVTLPLHWGQAPKWLFSRMAQLARGIIIAIIEEYGTEEFIKRISNPYWFQALGCLLGYDWHSSGLTTVTCGAIKQGLVGVEKEIGLFVTGGKGRESRKTPKEIESWSNKTRIKINAEELIYASKMSAKVDSTAIQDGYNLYHHTFFFTKSGSWAVVQQGLNYKTRLARRYHWYSKDTKSFISNPRIKICDSKRYKRVLNLVHKKSQKAQKVITEISKFNIKKILKEYKTIIKLDYPRREWIKTTDIKPENFEKVLLKTYEKQPRDFEELLNVKGVGPKSIRALALISELTYGTKASWRDPVKYSFAHGGKDGYPYPVDKATYDKSIEVLKNAIQKAKIDKNEKRNCLIRLLDR